MVRIRYHQNTNLVVKNKLIEKIKPLKMALRKSNLSKKIKKVNIMLFFQWTTESDLWAPDLWAPDPWAPNT